MVEISSTDVWFERSSEVELTKARKLSLLSLATFSLISKLTLTKVSVSPRRGLPRLQTTRVSLSGVQVISLL